jgi:asparagine synthase (glutamine-hydrolysing)
MCGIAGIVARNGRDETAAGSAAMEGVLLKMLAPIRHRGDPFHFAERAVTARAAIGTNRLAIVDRAHGTQPVFDATGRFAAVVNGEIYNHASLRSELRDLGVTFSSESDTEVFLQAYLRWGPAFVHRVEGMFGAVIVDMLTQDVFAARDHVGIKPLYFARDPEHLYFASERKSFIELGVLPEELPPGSYFANGRIEAYCDYRMEDDGALTERDAIAECRDAVDRAVRSHVATDLPIAVLFSGGLDSTIVLHLAHKHHRQVTAFSVGTPDSADVECARRYCHERGIPHVVTEISRAQNARTIPRAIYYGEFFEPVDISDMVVMSTVYATIAAHGFKVALTGDGSDEIFAGYDLFQQVDNPNALGEYRLKNLFRTDLQRTDRSSMSYSVESRVPLLAENVVRLGCRIPYSLKVRHGVEKYVLREAFRQEIPAYLLDRPKIRMPEGIGIRDDVFRALPTFGTDGPDLHPDFTIDSPQVEIAARMYGAFGYPLPTRRFKAVGKDYFPGGYFDFKTVPLDPRRCA